MSTERTLLYYGALLHDIGKVLCRNGPGSRDHARVGADFICQKIAPLNEQFAGSDGQAIADQVRYHHAAALREARELPVDSLAYITCFAESVAEGTAFENGEDEAHGGRDVKLRRIFNTLKGRQDDATIEHDDYDAIGQTLREALSRIGVSSAEVCSLLSLLDSATDSIPASTDAAGLIDVPFCDHARTTAGIAACVQEYLRECGVIDYRSFLLDYDSNNNPNAAEMFILYSCDMSGIQDFIYNISGSGALKQLRARSMYLELLLEHIVDELLQRINLCRANLLYTGGGHAYLLLPNTEGTKSQLESFGAELTSWLIENYRTDLYVASAWVACSADDLANRGEDKTRYPNLYRLLSRRLSEAKSARYDAATIRALNYGVDTCCDHSRECSECHRSDLHLDEDNKCTLCAALGIISKSLVERDVFVVDRDDDGANAHVHHPGLALPFGCRLRMYTRNGYLGRESRAYRAYVKNGVRLEGESAIGIMMGDYMAEVPEGDISVYASRSMTLNPGENGRELGIRRLGVLRADVDDLGATFVSGLPNDRVSIGRTSTLSRALSYFFKSQVNDVLRAGGYQVQIIYSGGDDLFIIGNWSDVLYAAIDIRKALEAYTGNGTLTISGGIGMYGKTYPIARMAEETGKLEDAAKNHPAESREKTKNAIAMWSADAVFGWDEFIGVVEPRMREVRRIFEHNEKGSAFIYRLIALLRSFDSVASAPRLAYLLARSFEDDHAHGGEICRKLYAWAQDPKERRCLVAAMEWYVCSIREGSDE